MRTAIAICLFVLGGCASSGVIQTDPDTYMLTKKNAGGMFGNVENVKADLYVEANEYCARTNRQVQALSAETQGAIPAVRMGGATLTFKCVPR